MKFAQSQYGVGLFLNFLAMSQGFAASTAKLLNKTVTGNGRMFAVSVASVPSKGEKKATGYCGAGEEVTLLISDIPSNKVLFSKLVESCLENIELQDGSLGSENSDSLSRAIKFGDSVIQVRWLSIDKRDHVTGRIDLTSGTPKYTESVSARQ
jgi:hypothetical protein